MSKIAAMPALIILILGVALLLPSEKDIGVLILKSFNEALCTKNQTENVACQQIGLYVFVIRLIGVFMIVGDIAYIINQFQKGNLI